MKLTLGKDKRLKSHKRIERLFLSGNRIKSFPLSAVYFLDKEQSPQTQIAVSVPKRNFKKSVDRNLLKRRIREAFRINQQRLNPSCGLDIIFIYFSREILDYSRIEKAVLELITSLNRISDSDISIESDSE